MDEIVNVMCCINDLVIETSGNLNNSIVSFCDGENNLKFDLKNLVLVKENIFEIDFMKKTCTIDNVSFNISVINIDKKNDNNISVFYSIGEEEFRFSLIIM